MRGGGAARGWRYVEIETFHHQAQVPIKYDILFGTVCFFKLISYFEAPAKWGHSLTSYHIHLEAIVMDMII